MEFNQKIMEKLGVKKWQPILGVTFVQFSISSLSFGNFALYLISYMREYGPYETRVKDVGAIYATMLFAQAFISVFMYELEKYFGTQTLMLMGSYLTSFGIMLSYFTASNYVAFLITYALIANFGYIISYSCSTAYSVHWVEETSQKQLMGFLAVVRSFGSIFFIFLETLYLNQSNYFATDTPYINFPNEKYFNQPELLLKVPRSFFIKAMITFSLQTLGHLYMTYTPSPPTEGHKMKDYKPISETITKSTFWLIWFISITHYFVSGFYESYWKIMLSQQFNVNVDDKILMFFGTAIFILNIFGRAIPIFIFSKISTPIFVLITSLIYTFSIFVRQSNFTSNQTFVFTSMGLIFLLQGAFISLFPALGHYSFSEKRSGTIFSYLYTSRTFAAFLMAFVMSHFPSTPKFSIAHIMMISAIISTMLCVYYFYINLSKMKIVENKKEETQPIINDIERKSE